MIFINRFFFPDHSATSQMLSDLAFGLAAEGERVVVITSRQGYDAPELRLPARETISGVDIRRTWTSRFGRANLAGRAFDYLTFYISATWELWRCARRGEVVIVKTDPPMLAVVAGLAARLRGAKVVNWLQDIFPEVATELGMGSGPARRALYGMAKRLRDRSLRSAARTVAIGERMAQRVAELGVPPERIRVITNWADGALIRPVVPEANPLRAEWGLAGTMVVGYSGNLGRAHDYRTILDAIAHLEGEARTPPAEEPVIWLFIGGGAQYEAFKREVAARELCSVRFRPYQPRERLAQSLSVPDVHLVTLRPNLEGLIVPSKFYGVAAAARPTVFIGDEDGEIARVLRRNDCGIVIAEGDGVGLARALRQFATQPEIRAEFGTRARAAFERQYDRPIAVSQWRTLLNELGAT